MDQSFEQKMELALELDRWFAINNLGGALRPEAKIIFLLLKENGLGMKQAISLSGLSYRGFYLMLKRMTDQGLVVVEDDRNDRRVRRVHPAPRLLELIGRSADGQASTKPIGFARTQIR